MHPLIDQKRHEIEALCRRYRIRQLEVFGSAARGTDFDPSRSDADFLVEFEPGAQPGFKDFLEMKEALQQMLGRNVDLVDRKLIEQSRNYLRRRHILEQAETVYVA
jgi:uncharacterized protein